MGVYKGLLAGDSFLYIMWPSYLRLYDSYGIVGMTWQGKLTGVDVLIILGEDALSFSPWRLW